ncbi:hypothetical protein ABIA35_006015 [Catenulispora sp. MAP12-49]|uniref:hypothetical protein n=1 Tax=Catenulispora sp. MAP12-49 TaxID=3156302 RepID=UPI003516C0AF
MSYYPSVIARPNSAGFAGRTVHTAGPPEYVIGLLTWLYHGPFGRDLDAMQRFLINEHPGGWSQLGDDPTADTGWNNDKQFGRDGFVCYCHGDRHKTLAPFTQDSDATFVDWLYVISADGIDVSQADWGDSEDFNDDTPPAWRHLGRVGWDDDAARIKTIVRSVTSPA